jgi:hypothetical protein
MIKTNPIIQDVLTASEVDKLWRKSPSTTRSYLLRGYFNSKEARRSCGTWLITMKGAQRVFGPLPTI